MAGIEVQGFQSTFYSFGKGSFDPKDWSSYFLNYDPSQWNAEGDGVLQFFSNDRKRYSLAFVHLPDRGFVLQLDCRELDQRKTEWCKFAVGNRDKMDVFEGVNDGLTYPSGCILPPDLAWLAVEDFLAMPTEPSSRIEWADDVSINWPE